MALLDEKIYRRLVDDAFRRIDAAFETVDPDAAEVSLGQGTLSIAFPGNLRCILTPQPPVRQMWMAFRDRAWHFDWNAETRRWLDDRGQSIDLYRQVADITRAEARVTIDVKADG